MAGLFGQWQNAYATAGIATFPVRDKRPAVKGYLSAGLKASALFATKFPEDDQFGFACRRSGITVLDVDSPDERLLCDALSEFGSTPIIVRTGSGNHQAWYRNGGEGRHIRPDPSRPIDILGDGFVVAPPSVGSIRCYEIICGSLSDIPRLPLMRAAVGTSCLIAPVALPDVTNTERIATGKRNDALWRHCMDRAPSCASIDELMEAAVRSNATSFYEPLPDSEVLRVVASAWSKQISGDNWFGAGRRVVFHHDEIDTMLHNDPDAYILLTLLYRNHWGRTFVVANACRWLEAR